MIRTGADTEANRSSVPHHGSAGPVPRDRAPVFVIGSPRSGTTLLYHMLLSAGGFAYYRAETHVFNSLAPRFGDLSRQENRVAMTERFIGSDMFRITSVDPEQFRASILEKCSNAGEFLQIFMDLVCRTQGVSRWAETTPEHALYLPEIKRTIPQALIVHVVRDGRDVAVSMAKQEWVRPPRAHAAVPERACGAYWMRIVTSARRAGRRFPADYLEVRYEDLVETPQAVLNRVGEFIGQPLNHDAILRVGVGSVSKPNTSFPGATSGFRGRWRSELSTDRARSLEALLRPLLNNLGYPLEFSHDALVARAGALGARTLYGARFALKHWIKSRRMLSTRLVSLARFEPGAVKKEFRARAAK